MPWPEKQREAIFLNTKRKKGLAAAKKLMREAGYGTGGKKTYAPDPKPLPKPKKKKGKSKK